MDVYRSIDRSVCVFYNVCVFVLNKKQAIEKTNSLCKEKKILKMCVVCVSDEWINNNNE